MEYGVEAQIICTFLIPDEWDEEMMEEWLTNLLAMENGAGLQHFFFAYECKALYLNDEWLTSDDGHRYHVLQIGRPTETDHSDPDP